MTLEEIESACFEVTDLKTLYRFQLDLAKKISEIHLLLFEQSDERRKNILKGNLSWSVELLEVVKCRQVDERNAHGKFNYNFRQIAQKRLSPIMYEQISKEAST